ncbi:hypothetical protein [Nitrosomonas nitrosa]
MIILRIVLSNLISFS